MKNVVFIIPTGVGAAIGGHAGDASPAAKLIAQSCDKLILHPNVVNASDINEMPGNALYVEGSILDRFLWGEIELEEVLSNKILVAVNPPLKPETENAINAARMTIGANIEIVILDKPLIMEGWINPNGTAGGMSGNVDELIKQVKKYNFDALAVASPITVPEGVALEYFQNPKSRVNPWGAIEAKVSKQIATALYKPVAHAPIECDETKGELELFEILYRRVVDKRKAAEVVSNCYIHCILKGLHVAPRIGNGIRWSSVACMVAPYGCIGQAHAACFHYNIPVIAVKENTTALEVRDNRIIEVENYWEASGIVSCILAGVDPESVRFR